MLANEANVEAISEMATECYNSKGEKSGRKEGEWMNAMHIHTFNGTQIYMIWFIICEHSFLLREERNEKLNTHKWNTISQFQCVLFYVVFCTHPWHTVNLDKCQTDKNRKDIRKIGQWQKFCLSFIWCKENMSLLFAK